MDRGKSYNVDALQLGFRVEDEVGSQNTIDREVDCRRRHRRQRRDSASKREYGDHKTEDPSRLEVIERSITALAKSVEHMRLDRTWHGRPEPSRLLETPRYPTMPFSSQDRDAYVTD